MEEYAKKILILNASPRKKRTQAMVDAAALLLRSNSLKVEIIQLKELDIEVCKGCHNCINGSDCPMDDQAEFLKQKMIEARGIIMALPVYMTGIPGSLKTFIDRTADWFHRPLLAGKPFLSLVSTAGSYGKSTGKELQKIAMHWACAPSGSWVRTAWQPISEDAIEESKSIKYFLKMVEKGSEIYRPSWKHLYLFTLQKVLARNILELDYHYWLEKNWMESSFFFFCKIGILKKLSFRILYGLLVRIIKKQ